MDNYYVNDNIQVTGKHQVHKDSCTYFPQIVSHRYLGYFSSCHAAIEKAREIYSQVDGCKYCSEECHKR